MPKRTQPHHRHQPRDHRHGVMSGWIVRPYDLLIGGVLMRGAYRRIAEHLTTGIAPGGRVLDIGTGPGRLVETIARRRPELTVVGIDPSADMIARAARRTANLPNAEVKIAASEDLPLGDASVDAVVSSLSSHHWADPEAALAEQVRVLVPGGRLWLVDLAGHVSGDIESQLEAAGLWLTEENAFPSGTVGLRLRVFTAVKPRDAA
jgi:ubiquinone/menaquinone biosynthesis C-methylase UbiE